MNVSELARRLRVTPHEMLTKLPELGFDIGARAIKVDDRVAEQIIQKWMESVRRERLRNQIAAQQATPVMDNRQKVEIILPAVLAVRDFAGLLRLPVTKVIQQLMKAGILASQNERIDFTTAAIIAEELGFKPVQESAKQEDWKGALEEKDIIKERLKGVTEGLVTRPPVVVIMGHVDHGKTRTLDAIRKTNVMEGESGGITQHIGAYQVEKNDRRITFIDTPGHEAFTVMRSRGAKVADVAVLVVAADDGVQPQTKEAADIIRAAKLPFVVALNKIDKPDADPNRVLGQLAEIGINVEEWGGNVPLAKISAKTGVGIDALLDTILLVADIEPERIMARPGARAAGSVIEAHVNKGEGPVATIIVQDGTLRINDSIGIAGAAYGRVRAMRDWNGQQLKEAPPGTPVKILGFKVPPVVGDVIEVPEHPSDLEQKMTRPTRQVADAFTATKSMPVQGDESKRKIMLNVILKTDVLGSLEALLGMIEKVTHDLVGVDVIQKGLGNVTEVDVERAANSMPSVVYGFNVLIPAPVSVSAREKGVDVKKYNIIYELFDDILARLNALLPQETIIVPLGQAEVAGIFRTEPGRMVAGAKIKEGKLVTGCKVRVWRGEDPIGEGILETLQSGKSAVKELGAGQEGGFAFKGKTKLELGDRLEAYIEESKTRKIEFTR